MIRINYVYLKNQKKNQIEGVKIGYNFFLLWFSGLFFGIISYLRGITKYGIYFTTISIAIILLIIPYYFNFMQIRDLVTSENFVLIFLYYFYWYCSYICGKHGNKLYIKYLLSKGYEFANTDPEVIRILKEKWNI